MTADGTSGHRLRIHPHEHAVVVQGREVMLTPREYEIARKLLAHPGWVFSAGQLSVDDDDSEHSPESVSVLVSRLRRKLRRAGALDTIETVRGIGYRLRAPMPADAPARERNGRNAALHDAAWHLHEAVIELDHACGDAERAQAIAALEETRARIQELIDG